MVARASDLRVAAIVDGSPVIRSMHGVVHDGALWLHGTPRGTLSAAAGSAARVQIQAEEVVARIPSWMRDAERACPATTYYRSALVDGIVHPVDDPAVRAAVLQRMMEVLQPEGRHRPITADDRLYAAAVRGLGVWRVDPEAVSCVEKLGQDQSAAHVAGILRGLWARGEPGDVAAIEAITDAHPEHPVFADVGVGRRPRCHPRSPSDVAQAVALTRGRYWNEDQTDAQLAGALTASTAWAAIEDGGRIVATARAISDRTKRSWVYDVAVADDRQRSGLGSQVMRLLLDHPAVRATEVNLGTRDAAGFYTRLGFVEVTTIRRGNHPSTLMRRPRPGPVVAR